MPEEAPQAVIDTIAATVDAVRIARYSVCRSMRRDDTRSTPGSILDALIYQLVGVLLFSSTVYAWTKGGSTRTLPEQTLPTYFNTSEGNWD
jgi:hypothetical protein